MQYLFEDFKNDFFEDLNGLSDAVNLLIESSGIRSGATIAISNSIYLVLVTSFEKFVRQMASEYALYFLRNNNDDFEFKNNFLENIWRNFSEIQLEKIITSSGLTKNDFVDIVSHFSRLNNNIFVDKSFIDSPFGIILKVQGKVTQAEIDRLFNLMGINNICNRILKFKHVENFMRETNEIKPKFSKGQVYNHLRSKLKDIIDKRNMIAHQYDYNVVSGPTDIQREIGLLRAFADDLTMFLLNEIGDDDD